MVTTLLELVGFTMVAVGVGMIYTPAGVIVGGVLVALAAFLASGGRR